jgi:hypothetical protein
VRLAGYVVTAAADQEVQVSAGAGLLDVLGVQPGPAPAGRRIGRYPRLAASGQLVVTDL